MWIKFGGESRGFTENLLNILSLASKRKYLNEYSGLTRAFAKFVRYTLELNSDKFGDLLKPDKIFFHKHQKENYLNEYSGLTKAFAIIVRNTWELNSEEKVGDLLKPDKIFFN